MDLYSLYQSGLRLTTLFHPGGIAISPRWDYGLTYVGLPFHLGEIPYTDG